jgi:TetR/AcrR family transcriptional repressor of multidrug resistance operon
VEDLTEKKQAIFESLLDLIKDHGFHGAPMSQLARNAGVAAGTIYHYFESKEQLICELDQYNRARISRVIEGVLNTDGSYEERFYRLWNELYRFYVKHPNVLIFFEQFINSPYNSGRYLDNKSGPLYQFFQRGIREGVFQSTNAEILMVLVFGSINATAKLSTFGSLHIGRQQLDKVAGMLWRGITIDSSHSKETSKQTLRTK